MTGSSGEFELQMSVFDRLLDHDPDQSADRPRTDRQSERLIRDSIRRDVQNLLNTRRSCIPFPEEFGAKGTVLDYGVEDFVGHSLTSKRQRSRFLGAVRDLLLDHEPRFKSVEVTFIEDRPGDDRSLRFKIDAVVYSEPVPETLSLASEVEPVARSFSVEV